MGAKSTSKEKKSVVATIFRFSPIIGAVVGLLVAALFVMSFGVNPGQFLVELGSGALGKRPGDRQYPEPGDAVYYRRSGDDHSI